MLTCFTESKTAIPIAVVLPDTYAAWLSSQSTTIQSWLKTVNFKAEAGSYRMLPNADGSMAGVVLCLPEFENFWSIGSLPLGLPEGDYQFDESSPHYVSYAVAWGLGSYQFTRYKAAKRQPARLVLAASARDEVTNLITSISLIRDLINTPTENMGPSELADAAKQLAAECGAICQITSGDALLKANYPLIHAVGRACDDAPCLIDLRWGEMNHPKVTLVGKGVCFDTGGLDLKPCSAMQLMKKDMGGAANVLGLARMIMQAKLPVRLRVLIPAVENSVSGNAFRPGDVLKSRNGLTVEVGNTDAEGRLVLADAITEAVSETPALLIDLSTLTGAARVALGTELPAIFSNHDQTVNDVISACQLQRDYVWRLPLYEPYMECITSNIADLNNNSSEPYGGAITAALFLKAFVPCDIPWMHVDMMAWNLRTKPGRPIGGEAMVVRGLFSYLKHHFN